MKLNSLLTLAALTAVGTASAAVTTVNTLCRIEINSGTKDTIVAVPLVGVGGSAVKLVDLVLTDNLQDDDQLLYKDGSTWKSWEIDNGAWSPVAVSVPGKTTIAGADETLAQGGAFWVTRKDVSKPFYIYGQVAVSQINPCILESRDAKTYLMMGNGQLADVAVGSNLTGTPVEGDMIKVVVHTTATDVERTYIYDSGAWKKVTLARNATTKRLETTYVDLTSADVIPAGQGFWYVAKASGTAE